MQRYCGQQLKPEANITVIGSCKVGNFVVTLPLLRALRRTYPAAIINFWGSEATRDFEEALCDEGVLNSRISWDLDDSNQLQLIATAAKDKGCPDLVINCDGFNPLTQVLSSWLRPTWVAGASLTRNSRSELPWGDHPYQRFLADPDWDTPAFLNRYKGFFQTNYIAELLCKMAFIEPENNELEHIQLPWQMPKFKVPQVLIHCTTTRAAKIWPFKNWKVVLNWCKEKGIEVGLVGAAPARQAEEYHSGDGENQLLAEFQNCGTLVDLRGRTNLIELAGASRLAKAVISVDAGPLHIAAAVGTPVLAIVGNNQEGVGASPIRLWLPHAEKLERTVSSATCFGCEEHRYRNDACTAASHQCMDGVEPEQVLQWLEQQLIIKKKN